MVLKRTGIVIAIFLASFSACKDHYSLTKKEASHQDLKNQVSSSKFDSIILPYKKILGNEMEKELVMCEGDLTKEGSETTIGNFICDAMKWTYDSIAGLNSSAIVLMNRGGIRSTIAKGMVTVNAVFEVMPFDNELEVVVIHGSDLKEVVKRIVEKKHAFRGLVIKADKEGNYSAAINGVNVGEDSTYSMLCADFVVNGGDGFTFGQKLIQEKKLGITIRDAIINYCKHLKYTGKTIIPYKDGRFEISK